MQSMCCSVNSNSNSSRNPSLRWSLAVLMQVVRNISMPVRAGRFLRLESQKFSKFPYAERQQQQRKYGGGAGGDEVGVAGEGGLRPVRAPMCLPIHGKRLIHWDDGPGTVVEVKEEDVGEMTGNEGDQHDSCRSSSKSNSCSTSKQLDGICRGAPTFPFDPGKRGGQRRFVLFLCPSSCLSNSSSFRL